MSVMMMVMCGGSAVVGILESTSRRRDALLASALAQEVPSRE
jgi:hypothetical protein